MSIEDYLFTLALKEKAEESYQHPCFNNSPSEAIIDCIIFIAALSAFATLVLG